MRFVSVDLTYEQMVSLAKKFASDNGLEAIGFENRSGSRTISKGKNKGRLKSDCHFSIRPPNGSDKYRKCKNSGSAKEPRITRQAYTCSVGYIAFAQSILEWIRDGNEELSFEWYSGGKKYNSIGRIIEFIELAWQEFYGSGSLRDSISQINSFNGRVGQEQFCCCLNGFRGDGKELCNVASALAKSDEERGKS